MPRPKNAKSIATERAAKAAHKPATEETLRAIEAQAIQAVEQKSPDKTTYQIDEAKAWLDGGPKPDTQAKSSNVKVAQVHAMIHDDGRQYTFRPQGEETQVLQNCGADVRRFSLPTEEARQLWRRLWKQGFRPW